MEADSESVVRILRSGYFSDSSRMFMIGNVEEKTRQFVEDVKESVKVGLSRVKPWNFLGDMGSAVNEFCMSKGYSVVREIGGHGVGLEFHEDPWVSYVSKAGTEAYGKYGQGGYFHRCGQ